MIIHKNITITGRFQRTGFRFSAMQSGVKIGVSGLVKYNHDDQVYMEIEGSKEQVDEFIAWCKSGPLWNRVTQISIENAEVKNLVSFSIL